MPNSHIDLKAPKTGLLAGLLFFEDPDDRPEPRELRLGNLLKVVLGAGGHHAGVELRDSEDDGGVVFNLVNRTAGQILWPVDDYGKKVFGKTVRQLIASDDARNLLVTIYFPNGLLHVAGKSPIAAQSAYTIIVARKIRIDEGPDMVLNTGYDKTDVPVPDGVGPVNGNVALVN